ncbi:MAG TPA: beta-galactosidase [Bryobacteraceae bacterium]|jgi:hypothetical protein
MRNLVTALLLALAGVSSLPAKVVVFWQDGFPTAASQPLSREVLGQALDAPVFTGIEALRDPAALSDADLLVLPYGSAFPAEDWSAIRDYLRAGGNLLILGGQPFRVPVTRAGGKFVEAPPQDTYSRELDFRHTYEVPRQEGTKFAWKSGYAFLGTAEVRARRLFAAQGGLDGLGYLVNSDGVRVAAPVVVADHNRAWQQDPMLGARIVMLDFDPEPGYWESAEGIALIRAAAGYARQGATAFWQDTLFSTLRPGETPLVGVHLRSARRQRLGLAETGEAKVELLSGTTVLESARVACSGPVVDEQVVFRKPLPPGFYTLRGVYEEGGQAREFYRNGFWVEDGTTLKSGPVLGVHGDFLTRDGKPFFPVGTNYFNTADDGWDFSWPRNAWTWETDFAEMERHGVTFVRTGVWLPELKFVEEATGAPGERFLRNLEAYLLCARRHNILVNFTFFAFFPHPYIPDPPAPPGPNPYMDPVSVRSEQDYMLPIVNRFKDVPWLSWDLINEPSFSNPRRPWRGNTPNGDAVEAAAWHRWLREKYTSIAALAAAWAVPPEELGSFDGVPLPDEQDLSFSRSANPRQVRALDYNLFAQEMFTRWVRSMVTAIRATGSMQLVNVGQDEGGVVDRVLNQFYAAGGVAFTTNHTYWRDDVLLWESLAAKRPGVPNIVGETGYQPVWSPDGAWRYDEVTAYPLLERKWALGFAAASSGFLQWDWSRSLDFGMERADGSAKTWQAMMRGMGQFAEKAAPWATAFVPPQVALVLPQSLQLSVLSRYGVEAQQTAVRALYHYARAEAYAVGEYQIDLLGDPKLIVLPSPGGLTATAWEAIRKKVEGGATLLVSGRFDQMGLAAGLLTIRENVVQWPEGKARLTYGGDKTTFLDRAALADGSSWAEKPLGQGRILFSPLPLELNDNAQAVGDVYRYALKVAGVVPTYSTDLDDPGILICPTRFPHATLYVLTSESNHPDVRFRDGVSGKEFSGRLDPGRAALLLVGDDGAVLASYNWNAK